MRSVIIYTYYNSESSNYNLNFFVKTEVKYREDIDYIIVINGFYYHEKIVFPNLDNLFVLRRENKGFDYGGHHYALQKLELNNKKYDYYFFMNSSVIGPIIPHYLTEHWSNIFIRKITPKVKLVGTTIVCLPPASDRVGGEGPHVEGFFFMTDQFGLDLLKSKKTIFCNHESKYSAIVNGEYAMSEWIIQNGYSIDCMLRQYQGVNWEDINNWKMNSYLHPSKKNCCFGHDVIPYEVIFHKWNWSIGENGLLGGTINFNIIKDYVSECGV